MSTETAVFQTEKHTYCVPASSVMLRRKHENAGFAVRFLRDGKQTGLGHPYEVTVNSFDIYPSMSEAYKHFQRPPDAEEPENADKTKDTYTDTDHLKQQCVPIA